MKAIDCYPGDQLFTHTDLTGVVRHFNTSAMGRAALMQMVTPVLAVCELYEDLITHIIKNHGIEDDHVQNVGHLADHPVMLVVFEDGTNLLVDGNHRAVWRWRNGYRNIKALVFHVGTWEQFLVEEFDQQIAMTDLLTRYTVKKPPVPAPPTP